jgi:hypothetical protein
MEIGSVLLKLFITSPTSWCNYYLASNIQQGNKFAQVIIKHTNGLEAPVSAPNVENWEVVESKMGINYSIRSFLSYTVYTRKISKNRK